MRPPSPWRPDARPQLADLDGAGLAFGSISELRLGRKGSQDIPEPSRTRASLNVPRDTRRQSRAAITGKRNDPRDHAPHLLEELLVRCRQMFTPHCRGLNAQTGSGVGIKIGIKWISADPQIVSKALCFIAPEGWQSGRNAHVTRAHNPSVRWRPHYLSRIELFIGGITLSATLGYALSGSLYGVAGALIAAALLVADALRRGGMPGLWLVALGFCASVSRLSVTETETTLGAFRIPVIAGGSLLAIAFGFIFDPEFRISLRRLRP
jgi:hypothetical protein